MKNKTYDLICFDWNAVTTTEDQLEIILHQPTRELLPWRQELYLAAENIASQSSNIILALSGGIDSEVMARVFLEKNIPFRAVSWRYNRFANLHDIVYADRFCRSKNIPLEIIDIDLIQFVEQDVERYKSLGFEFTHPAHAIRLKMIEFAESCDATLVCGGGDQRFNEHNNQVCIGYTRDQPAFYNFIENHCRNKHYPLFFGQNIHILLAYRQIDLVQLLLTSPHRYFRNSPILEELDKMLVYHAEWPDMVHRPKYHGFEKSVTNIIRASRADLPRRINIPVFQ